MRYIGRSNNRDRHGIAMVWVAILGMVFLAFVGLASDTGYVFMVGHQLQNAADASALAGAAKVHFNQVQAVTDAVTTAAANHAAGAAVQLDSANGDVLVGNYDRSTATFKANTSPYNSVRVLARRTSGSPGGAISLIFAPMVGITTSNVSRTATAMAGGTLGAGIVILDPTRKSSLGANGNPVLNVGTAAIQVNSSDTNAVKVAGNKSSVTASELRIDGGFTTSGNPSVPSKIYTGATPVDDPLKNLPIPSKGTDLGAINVPSGSTVSYGPGYYSGGISMNASNSTLNLSPGIYVLGPPGLSITGGSLNATGCMFFLTTGNNGNTYGSVTLTGNGVINISPPTSGTYAGMSIFQDPSTPWGSKTDATIVGTANLNLQGTVYLPSINFNMSGTSQNFANQIIVDTINVSGNGQMTVNYDGRNPVTINNVFLVN